ncbi:PfaD family polyunsaturated fatty acid/polyketide biosynthesis protein [Ectothiorhodospiraceae bacterium BW-2]|nr:PfaD family polyunsaturated fatty acid/polyketide biosynthesis protein [Ectothiorhodospiraceae bacterium BW-2]
MAASLASCAYSLPMIEQCVYRFRERTDILYHRDEQLMGLSQQAHLTPTEGELIGTLPPLYPEWLGDRHFLAAHHCRFAYVGGAMARGIASAAMVIELGKIGALGFFGSAGLATETIRAALIEIATALTPLGASWGVNLIHTPATPEQEERLVDLYLALGVRRVSAAAFMGSNRALTRYVCLGLYRDESGVIRRQNYLFPKVSRPEVAAHFMQPAPTKMLQELVASGAITPQQAELAAQVPLAEDLTVESDSGGHTDSRPLNSLFGATAMVRDQLQRQYNFATPVRLGAAGSLGTPQAIAAAFTLGASYVLLGSVHQATVESALSNEAKTLLASADIADTITTPSADMFELGGKVQVLKKGTMMGMRGNRLQEIYHRYSSIEQLPAEIRTELEQKIFRQSLPQIWSATCDYFQQLDPRELQRANESPKYKMALLFRWYLGKSSQWALQGDSARTLDYQIWCGPALGAFNRWVAGSFLEPLANRHIAQVALNLLEGAALYTRAQQCRTYGVPVAMHQLHYQPQPMTV